MFYIFHIDHHGEFQGILRACKTLKRAKVWLDNEDPNPRVRRFGRVGILNGTWARVIIELDVKLKKVGMYDYELPDDENPVNDKHYAEIDRVLDLLH